MDAIELVNINKNFGNFSALKNISLKIKQGEIHALLGENGAGKSTIMSILFGSYKPDSGFIINKKKLKIGMVHQRFQLVENYTVLDNIILGNEYVRWLFFLNRKKSIKKVNELLKKYSFDININEKIKDISVCAQQKTEILKMLYRDVDVLIFDEPTSILTPQEIKSFLKMLLNLKKEGKTIIFVTHKIDEIAEVADRVTILKKGELIDTFNVNFDNLLSKDELTKKMAKIMIGENCITMPEKKVVDNSNKIILEVKKLWADSDIKKDAVKNVSFSLKEGEIIGIVGIDGNGQRELINAITGLGSFKKGEIIFKGISLKNEDVFTRNKLKMSNIPEDQHKHGLVLNLSVYENLIIRDFYTKKFSFFGFLKNKSIKKNAKDIVDKYNIKISSGIESAVKNMSGGNQQKLIIAREIEREPSLLIAFQPTRGIDYKAMKDVHSHLIEQKNKGVAIILVSFELNEIFELSDEILVMFNGSIVGRFNPKEITHEELGLCMSGSKKIIKESVNV